MGGMTISVHIDGAMVRCTYLSLVNYLAMAYDVKDYQIVGPDWLASEHFDIAAKRPEGVAGEAALRGNVEMVTGQPVGPDDLVVLHVVSHGEVVHQ